MTIDEAIKVLRTESVELGGNAVSVARWLTALDVAVKALEDVTDKDAGKNEPLTLGEVRKMGGEPVWIVEYPDWGHWELSADAEDYVTDREPSFYGMKHNDPAGRYGLHKLGWLAYHQKPEESHQ